MTQFYDAGAKEADVVFCSTVTLKGLYDPLPPAQTHWWVWIRLQSPHLYQHFLGGGTDLQQLGAKHNVKSDPYLQDMVPPTMSQTKAEKDERMYMPDTPYRRVFWAAHWALGKVNGEQIFSSSLR